MNKGFIYSRRLAWLAFAALTAAAGAWGLRHEVDAQLKVRRAGAISTQSELAAEIAPRAAYDAAHLSARRAQIARFHQQLGAESAWGSLVNQLGRAWVSEPATREDSNGYSSRSAAFRMIAPTVADWPFIIEAVKKCEAIVGVKILEVEIKSSGNRERRALDLVRILVIVRTRRGGANPQS